MIDLIANIFLVITFWLIMWLLHEFMHAFQYFLEGCKSAKIEVIFRPYPTMGCGATREDDAGVSDLVDYAGGIYTAIIFFILSVIFISNKFTSKLFLIYAYLQLIYGFYEGLTLKLDEKKRRLYRYLLYLIILAVGCVIWLL